MTLDSKCTFGSDTYCAHGVLSKVHLTLRSSAISCAPGVQRTCTPSALSVYFSSDYTVYNIN